ncbi:MaoC family dehydratase N-terminal domain-containing protein [Haloterrigena sp. SYSU A558-1]|uniref:MaoC family dehydratase N-terminal domain-containing protein n=1 Tax=Haloterrigena gelatinilytica TaxID=2741724 RepID=A0A8J8GP89_9EURY|nr:MaoC family dehydratase [Haloterrigena gelatinilytica]NUB92715.1 MaoC family dehydratase N-terminal domain-containing protein [Haloterrigena gelatinilytica]NUC71370.1 MaoC family dehydratase N-terminal domain-containing protein [Haloterrigena gelatinilytica]
MSHQNAAKRNLAAMTDAWSAMTQTFLQSATAANRAAMSAMVPTASNGSESETVPASIPSIDHSSLDWQFDRTVDDPEHISVGDTVTFEKVISDEDVRAFAHVSGDTNRLHLDDEFAADTRFGERIVHGTLVSGLISAALARLPGLTIYLSQDLEFSGPVGIGDRVSARVEIVEDLGNDQYRLETLIRDEDDDATVINGEAVVLIDDLPEE